jgi:hypothetical protein
MKRAKATAHSAALLHGEVAEFLAPDGRRRALNAVEASLVPLEPAWVDFVYGARSLCRYIRADRRPGMRGAGLAKVHARLEAKRERLTAGERHAAFEALVLCAQENVPLPYWLGDAILDIAAALRRPATDDEPAGNLHELFGMEPEFPAGGKKAATSRRDAQLRGRLWEEAKRLLAAAAKAKKRPSLDDAIRQARATLNFPYSQTKARAMFEEQERIQREYFDAGKRTHKAP